jgi:hypothetical protein
MQLNVLNDLAEAMKALDGKKSRVKHGGEKDGQVSTLSEVLWQSSSSFGCAS